MGNEAIPAAQRDLLSNGQVNRPQIRPEERIVLSMLQRVRPARERLSSLVTPDTLRRWNRESIRRRPPGH